MRQLYDFDIEDMRRRFNHVIKALPPISMAKLARDMNVSHMTLVNFLEGGERVLSHLTLHKIDFWLKAMEEEHGL